MNLQIHVRRLLRSRAFVATAVLVLGLGLGANLILFNTAYALLWRPLRFHQPDRLVTIESRSAAGDLSHVVTGKDAWTVRGQTAEVAGVGLTGRRRLVSIIQGEDATDLASAQADAGYFRVLGLRPVCGRFFGDDDELGNATERPAVLAESAWRSHFGADPAVVGRSFVVQEGGARRQVRVVGIVPGMATLPFAADADLFFPIASASPAVRDNGGDAWYHAILRLRPGVSMSRASARMDAALKASSPDWGRFWMQPLRSSVSPTNRRTVALLFASSCLLLLLTCANLASLFAARSLAHGYETAVHLALGATRWRMFTANFREALLVCGTGTGLAFLVEDSTRPVIARLIPAVKNSGPELLSTGPVLLLFGLLAGLAVSCIVSVASGLRFRFESVATALAQGGRSTGTGRLRTALASVQLAIVLTLLTVSGMVGRSFLAALRTSPGLDPQGVVMFQVSLPGPQKSELAVIADLADRLRAISTATSVTFAAESPVGSPAFSTVTSARQGALLPADPMIEYRLIGPSYFEAIRAHLAAGRGFSPEEVMQYRPVAILNESAARLLFPADPPLGRVIHLGIGDRKSEVVGVVKEIRTEGLDLPGAPMVYLPYFPQFGLRFIVRTSTRPDAFLPLVRARLGAAGAGILVQRFQTLAGILDDTIRDRRNSGELVAAFAVLGLLISSVGLYGTLAAQVEQRRREFSLRMALGATARQAAQAIISEGMRIVLTGAVAGIGASIAAGRVMQKELYGVKPMDPASLAIALALLVTAAAAAGLVPVLKAGRTDLITTLNAQ